jgi:hypothetical protein
MQSVLCLIGTFEHPEQREWVFVVSDIFRAV